MLYLNDASTHHCAVTSKPGTLRGVPCVDATALAGKRGCTPSMPQASTGSTNASSAPRDKTLSLASPLPAEQRELSCSLNGTGGAPCDITAATRQHEGLEELPSPPSLSSSLSIALQLSMLPMLLADEDWRNTSRDARRLPDDMTVRPSGDIDRRRRAVSALCGDGLNSAYCSMSSLRLAPSSSACNARVVSDALGTGSTSSSSTVSAISFSEPDRDRPGNASSGLPKASGPTPNEGAALDNSETTSVDFRRAVPVPRDDELKAALGNLSSPLKLALRRRPREVPGLGQHVATASASSASSVSSVSPASSKLENGTATEGQVAREEEEED